VHGSEDALNTLLANLIENAIKYTGRGGTVRVSVQVSDGEVCMEVEDSGPGIPPGERERVFHRFYRRLHSSESGSGLGLAIARDIAGRHHASIALGTSHSLVGLVAIVRFRALNEVTPPAVPTDDGASAARNPVSKSDAA
jgi:signal transduction histidine kinase